MNATSDPDDLDFVHAFDAPAKAPPSLKESTVAENQEITEAATELQNSGFYVTIARKAKRVAPLASRFSILCIDDDTDLLKILARKLSLDGYAIRTASDRQTIVAELQKQPPPHLILLDVGLPDISGFEVLQKLRQHPTLGAIPVIMLTGRAGVDDVLQGIRAGADGYISKPFQFESLGTAIETVLGIR